jgi:hypothetical protein
MRVRSRASYRKRVAEKYGRTVREREVLPDGMKRCRDCGHVDDMGRFFRDGTRHDGHQPYCKPCAMKRNDASAVARHGSKRDYHLRRRYGIDSSDVDAMVQAQGGLCLLCRERAPEHVDHDHLTGTVRGVLCSCCNQGLGNFRDSAATLRAAIDYLERTTWQRTRICTGVYRLTSPRLAARRSASSSDMQRLISSRRDASCPPA